MQRNPFSRSIALAALIASAMSSGVHGALAGIPEYKSRGHGRGGYSGKGYGNTGTNWMSRLNGQTNGKRECERRLRQMDRDAAKRNESEPLLKAA